MKNYGARLLLATSSFALATVAQADVTSTYTYDALGRLVAVSTAGDVNNGLGTAVSYDPAGNRTSYWTGTGTPPAPPPPPPPAPPPPAPPPPAPAPPPRPGNQPPIANTDNITVTCNSGGGFNLLSNDVDPDGDPMMLTAVHSNGSFTISIGSPTGIASIGGGPTAGSFNGTYVVSDDHGNSTTGQINVTVNHGGPGGC